MIIFLINAVKIVFILGFLVFIHEGGHFIIAKLCKVKVNEFAIGFGPTIWNKQGKETKYALRLIPLGGFVSMEGEEERSEEEGSFSNASILRRIAIVMAGGIVNIVFALIVYFFLMLFTCNNMSNVVDTTIPGYSVENSITDNIYFAFEKTTNFLFSIIDNMKMLFTGNVKINQFMGPVGIGEVVAGTKGIGEFVYILALISISLGVTNLLPFPPLDGGKVIILLIEGIRKKPLNENVELKIQMIGFCILIGLSIVVTYNDILRIF